MNALRKCLVLLCALLLCAACTHVRTPDELVSGQDSVRDWGTRPPDPGDRARHEIDGKQPFEWWYFDGHLDDGRTFVGVFHIPSFVSNRPAATFTLYSPDWERQDYVIGLDPYNVYASTRDVHIETSAGFVRRVDENTYHVCWDIDDMRAEFTFAQEAPGWRPYEDDGDVNTDRRDFFWVVHQGRNRVSGTITQNGKTTEVSGVGYADHNWGSRPLNEITRRWVWGRIVSGEYTIIFADVDHYDTGTVSRPLYVARGGEMLLGTGSPAISQRDFATHPTIRRFYPREVDIAYSSEDISVDIRIFTTRMVEDVDLLAIAGYKGVSHWLIANLIARPAYFRIMAEYEGTITINGETEAISGSSIYEVMTFE